MRTSNQQGLLVEEDQIDEILKAVGRALHNWSRVEGQLINILWRCMETKTPAPATIVWGNIISIEPKLSIITQLLPHFLSDQDAIGLWGHLRETVKVRSRSRNNLAHGEVVRYETEPRFVPKYQSAGMGKLGYADTGPENAIDRLLENYEPRGYTAKDILLIADNFTELKAVIQWYYNWVIEFQRVPHELDMTPIPNVVSEYLARGK